MRKIVFLSILLVISLVSFADNSRSDTLKAFRLQSTPDVSQTLSLKGLIFITQGNLACKDRCQLSIESIKNIHYHTNLKGEQTTLLPPDVFVQNWQKGYCLPKNGTIEASLIPLDESKSKPKSPIYLAITQPSYDNTTSTLSFNVSQGKPQTSQRLTKQLLVFMQNCY